MCTVSAVIDFMFIFQFLISTIRCLEIKRFYVEQNNRLEDNVADLRRELSATQQELAQAKRLAGLSQDGLRQELATTEQRCQRLAIALETESKLRAGQEEQARRGAIAEQKAMEGERQVNALTAQLASTNSTLHLLQRQVADSQEVDLARRVQLLEADKRQLSSEVVRHVTSIDHLTRNLEAERSKASALETKLFQVQNEQRSGQQEAADRLSSLVTQQRQAATQELLDLRQASSELADRETRVLREARQAAEQELHVSRQRVSLLEQQLAEARDQAANDKAQRLAEGAELRGELKLKTLELASLRAFSEERSQLLKQSQLSGDRLAAELAAHRSAVSRLENDLNRKQQQYEQESSSLQRQLSAYQALEVEVDRAVIRAAGREQTEREEELELVRGIPCSPERRVQQAVFLAQRLLQAEAQRDEARNKANILQAELEEMSKGKLRAEQQLHLAAQPAVYLVNKLRAEENRALQHEHRGKELLAALQKETKRKRAAVDEAEQLRERLQMVLKQRGELETVKAMLQSLHEMEIRRERQEEESSDDDDDEDDEALPHEDEDYRRQQQLQLWRGGGDPLDRGEVEFEVSSGGSGSDRRAAAASSHSHNVSVGSVAGSRSMTMSALGLQPATMTQMILGRSPLTQGIATNRDYKLSEEEEEELQLRHRQRQMELQLEQAETEQETEDPEVIPLAFSSAH